MINHEFDTQSSRKERFAAAKVAFRERALQNDTLFDVLQTYLDSSTTKDGDLPEFGLEPTLCPLDDTQSTIGLRINRSTTTTTTYVGLYDYLPLCQLDKNNGEATVTPELEAALTAAGRTKADALEVIQAWQAAIGEMGNQFPESLKLDPMTDTFVLPEEFEARSHMATGQE
ncbi:hypothetical protein KC853_03310 [Candidatus Saccharibacteria bacterium]|nr:hypothetical protein [Candidatus Saccharibacteria bacterium]